MYCSLLKTQAMYITSDVKSFSAVTFIAGGRADRPYENKTRTNLDSFNFTLHYTQHSQTPDSNT